MMTTTTQTPQTDILAIARDRRLGGYECDRHDARRHARTLRDAGYRVTISRTAAADRRLLTWR